MTDDSDIRKDAIVYANEYLHRLGTYQYVDPTKNHPAWGDMDVVEVIEYAIRKEREHVHVSNVGTEFIQ